VLKLNSHREVLKVEVSSTIVFTGRASGKWLELDTVTGMKPQGLYKQKVKNQKRLTMCFLSFAVWCSGPPPDSASKKAITR
jgi:hypothetical protein